MMRLKLARVGAGEIADIPPRETSDADAETYAAWAFLVERIRTGQTDGMEELYQLFSKGIRFYLCRQLGPQELEDKVHDTFVVVVQAIRRGDLREPQRLMGFVRTIVRRQVAAHIDRVVHVRKEQLDMESTFGFLIRGKTRRKTRCFNNVRSYSSGCWRSCAGAIAKF